MSDEDHDFMKQVQIEQALIDCLIRASFSLCVLWGSVIQIGVVMPTRRKNLPRLHISSSRFCYDVKYKKQPTIALSTMEAEYIALYAATQEAIWPRQLKIELSLESKHSSTIIHCDN